MSDWGESRTWQLLLIVYYQILMIFLKLQYSLYYIRLGNTMYIVWLFVINGHYRLLLLNGSLSCKLFIKCIVMSLSHDITVLVSFGQILYKDVNVHSWIPLSWIPLNHWVEYHWVEYHWVAYILFPSCAESLWSTS